MITPLEKTPLHELLSKPILFDANIFMVGVENRSANKNASFESMKELYVLPLLESFSDIYVHEEVFRELDADSKAFLASYIGKNVTIVKEGNLYGKDPLYTTIFNSIATHELVNYVRGQSKDRGEVYSLAYAAYHNMNYFCSKEIMVDIIAQELDSLKNVDIITFDIILLTAYIYYARRSDNSKSKGQKSLYKTYCADLIRRHRLPKTLGEYIKESVPYL